MQTPIRHYKGSALYEGAMELYREQASKEFNDNPDWTPVDDDAVSSYMMKHIYGYAVRSLVVSVSPATERPVFGIITDVQLEYMAAQGSLAQPVFKVRVMNQDLSVMHGQPTDFTPLPNEAHRVYLNELFDYDNSTDTADLTANN